MLYLFAAIEKELGRDKKLSLQDEAILRSLFQLSTARPVCEMRPLFRAESQWTHFQALLGSPCLHAPWHVTTCYLVFFVETQ
jgi:hypothetical protein